LSRVLSMTATAKLSIEAQLEQMEFQADELRRKTEALRQKHESLVIDRIKTVVAHLRIAQQQIYGPLNAETWKSYVDQAAQDRPVRRRAPATQKYQDGEGNTWSGRGKRPHWFVAALSAGKTPEDLLVKESSTGRR